MFNHLSNSKNIIIAGCGGGYDIYAGFILYKQLISLNKNVILANYTFTSNITDCQGTTKIDDY